MLLKFQPNPGLPSTRHRRAACAFRDQSLFQTFQISLTSLQQLRNDCNAFYSSFVLIFFQNFPEDFFLMMHICLFLVAPCGVYFQQRVTASQLQELAISLSLKCLSFDFVGTSIDESSEEFGAVQVGFLLH